MSVVLRVICLSDGIIADAILFLVRCFAEKSLLLRIHNNNP